LLFYLFNFRFFFTIFFVIVFEFFLIDKLFVLFVKVINFWFDALFSFLYDCFFLRVLFRG
jgi:hypothetical protein